MKIALLTHSINPRGGVVHVLELGRALMALGHAVTLVAPAAPGQAFFRETPCRVELATAPPAGVDLAETVQRRIASLRSRGTPVVVELPGHESTRDELNCDRRLVRRARQWVMEKL